LIFENTESHADFSSQFEFILTEVYPDYYNFFVQTDIV